MSKKNETTVGGTEVLAVTKKSATKKSPAKGGKSVAKVLALRKDLVAAANDMSKIMEFEPPIPTGKGVDVNSIIADLRDNAKQIRPDDEFDAKTVATFATLNISLTPKKKTTAKKAKSAPRYSRVDALLDALQIHGKEATRDNVSETGNRLFMERGNSGNKSGFQYYRNIILSTFTQCGLADIADDGTIKLNFDLPERNVKQ